MLDLEVKEDSIIQHIKEKAIDFSINGIAIIDIDGNITYVNNSFLHMWGYESSKEIVGNSIVKYWLKKGQYAEILDFVMDKGGWRGELIAVKKNGTQFYVQLSISLIKNNDNNPKCIVASFIDITHRKKAEEEALKTMEYLNTVINASSDIICAFDKKNQLTLWNKTAEILLGYKKRDVLNKTPDKLKMFQKQHEINEILKTTVNNHIIKQTDLLVKTKSGIKKILNVSTSLIKKSDNSSYLIVLFGKDITYERESHANLIKGNSYLIYQEQNISAFDLFINLVKLNHKGLLITRQHRTTIKQISPTYKIKTIFLNPEKIGEFNSYTDLDSLRKEIEDFSINNKNTVILLDRIDYLVMKYSFNSFLDFLYKITTIMYLNNSLLLVGVDKGIISEKEFALLNAELQILPSQKISDIIINDYLFKILEYIYTQNQNNISVSYKQISTHFSIVKSTTAKRLSELEEKGLITVRKQGRTKIVFLSDKGKTLLQSRNVI